MTSVKHADAKASKPAMVRVLNGKSVPLALYVLVESHLAKLLPGLKLAAGRLYTLRKMYGEQDWQALGNRLSKNDAGRCFAHMVSYGKFPFIFVQYKRSCTKHYMMK